MRTRDAIEQRIQTLSDETGTVYDEERCVWRGGVERCVQIAELRWFIEGDCDPRRTTLDLSREDIDLLIAGLLCRVNHGHTTGEDHADLLLNLKHRAGITW